MTDVFKKVFLTGIGAVALTVEKAGEVIDDLVKKGEITFEQGKEMAKEYKDKFDVYKSEFDAKLDSKVKEAMKGMKIVTREEYDALLARVEALENAAVTLDTKTTED